MITTAVLLYVDYLSGGSVGLFSYLLAILFDLECCSLIGGKNDEE